jgi:hypothetical protein
MHIYFNIVLLDGCFDINPVLCPNTVVLHLLVIFYILVYWLILDVLILVVFYTGCILHIGVLNY